MSIVIYIYITIVHWVADFIFQAESWATGKSKSLSALLKHTSTYSIIWLLPTYIMTGDFWRSVLFSVVTFIFHTITDYFTSKIVAKKFAEGKYGSPIPNLGAFTFIGFDQVLHYTQLILTYYYIFIR